jgi:hypothetical protein
VVVFGGLRYLSRFELLADTWEFDGSTWRKVAVTGEGPSARSRISFAFDETTGRLSGATAPVKVTTLNDLWAWDGRPWTKLDGP